MQKTQKTIIRKEITFAISSFTYLESEEPNFHRSLRMEGVPSRCNYAMLQEQENGAYDDEA